MSAGRLLDRIASSGAQTRYVYDAGNRLRELRNRSPTGSLIYSYGYDHNGNRTHKWQGASQSGTLLQEIVYDQRSLANQITTAGVVKGGGSAAGGYVLYPNRPNLNFSRHVYAK